jgi:hypothetical protein
MDITHYEPGHVVLFDEEGDTLLDLTEPELAESICEAHSQREDE